VPPRRNWAVAAERKGVGDARFAGTSCTGFFGVSPTNGEMGIHGDMGVGVGWVTSEVLSLL
jgi:hypothetical protein